MKLFIKDSSDYELVGDWWKKRNMLIIPKDYLSDFGLINENAAMWLFPMITTKTAMIRYPITNPDVSSEIRNNSLDLVFEGIHNMSRDMGYTKLFCTTPHLGLIKRLKKYGYVEAVDNCKHFWGNLGE